jgi:hypothetical protein
MDSGSIALTGVPPKIDDFLFGLYSFIGSNCAQIYTASKLGHLGFVFGGNAQLCGFLSTYGAGDKCCGAAPVAPPVPPPVAPVAPPVPPPVAPIKPMMKSK